MIRVLISKRLSRLCRDLENLCKSLNIDTSCIAIEDLQEDIELSELNRDRDHVLMVIGTDRDVLVALQKIKTDSPPIAAIAPPGYSGYLASISWEDLDEALKKIKLSDYHIRLIPRIEACIDCEDFDEDHRKKVFAINEIAIFPQRSAVVLEYTLSIDGEIFWRDTADGIIVSTPLGSTAYALSAGGPIVLLNAEVFVIVPVNSVEPRRKPIVVSQNSIIDIADIASRYPVEVIADGVTRIRVDEKVKLRRNGVVSFIEIGRSHSLLAKKKLGVVEELQSLPPSAKFVFKMLELEGGMTIKELASKTLLPERTVRYALSLLIDRGLVERVRDPRDPRRIIFRVKRP